MKKRIFHIDMDAFFTSCEENYNPELKNKSVVVGSDPKEGQGRGVVSTCNYSARKFGIHSAMPISQAYKLNPKATFIRPNFQLYVKTSKKIMAIIKSYSDKFQKAGLDEAYLDVSDKTSDFAEAKTLAVQLKNEIFENEKITCSIGIANNKLLAKIASDYQKPDGITVVQENKKFLKPLKIRKLYGVGPKTEVKLKAMKIETIGQLAEYNKETLIKRFGVYGNYLSLSANGKGNDIVSQDYGRKTIGHERTFFEDVEDFTLIEETIKKLSNLVHHRLIEEKYTYKTVSIKVRLYNFDTYTRALTLNFSTNRKDMITKTAKLLFKEFIGQKIRLIGIRLSNLEETQDQRTINDFTYQ